MLVKYNKIVSDYINEFQETEYQKSRNKLIADFDDKIKVADDKQKEVLERLKASELEKLANTETLRKNTINTETTLVDVQSKNAIDEKDTPEQRIAKLQAVWDAEKAFKEAQFQEQLNQLGNDQDAIRNLTAKHNSELLADEKAHADAKKDLDKQSQEAKLESLNRFGQAAGQLSDILGKQTVAGKAMAVAQATIDTYTSATSAYKSMAGIPVVGPALGVVAAAAAVAAGVANVKKILAVNVPAKGGSGGGGAAPVIPTAPTINATALNPNQTQVQDVRVTNPQNQVVKAYIVDRDLQDQQDKSSFMNKLSSF